MNGIRKRFRILDSPGDGVLSNLGDYGEEEEEDVKEKMKVYECERGGGVRARGTRLKCGRIVPSWIL